MPRARPPAESRVDLKELRTRIDGIDDRILALLAERARTAERVAKTKRDAGTTVFHDPERERNLLARVTKKGAGTFPKGAIQNVFREVMSGCLSLEKPLHVAYLGPEGTFSQSAAQRLFGLAARYVEAGTIAAVFEAVRSGEVTYGVVPIENMSEGGVTQTADELIAGALANRPARSKRATRPVAIRQEMILAVDQCLLSNAKSLATIERVYSHPQALGQCRQWLGKNLPHAQLVQTASTSTAAREARSDAHAAAVGSALAAELWGVGVLRQRIQDRTENATRFLVLATNDAPTTGDDKTTLCFSVKDGRGALRRILSIFEDAEVNLTRIESRPSPFTAWQYVFLVDVEGHRQDPHVAKALFAAKRACARLEVLGSYPRIMVPPPR